MGVGHGEERGHERPHPLPVRFKLCTVAPTRRSRKPSAGERKAFFLRRKGLRAPVSRLAFKLKGEVTGLPNRLPAARRCPAECRGQPFRSPYSYPDPSLEGLRQGASFLHIAAQALFGRQVRADAGGYHAERGTVLLKRAMVTLAALRGGWREMIRG